MNNQKLKVGVIQQSCNNKQQDNHQSTEKQIRKLADDGVELILLQELHSGLYFCQTENTDHFDQAETLDGPSAVFFSQLAFELNIVLVISIFEKRSAGLYHNTALVIDKQQGVVGKYRKMHIPDDPGFYEKFYFTPGDHQDPFLPIQTSVGKLGVLICWDQWYPEAARLMALKGAEILLYPTAIGWDLNDDKQEQQRQLNAWKIIQQSHAVANGIVVVVANRVGFEKSEAALNDNDGISFWGNSFICGPQGELLVQADDNSKMTISCEIDINKSEQVRRIWPFLRDRRIDAYDDLSKRFRD
ncbi:MAG: carbon-nitrogen hydrolase [Saccharospirillaceae bacterium]|nr:carbon-nitrogen hydrolase [Pseudomonadales bacterium]NRB81253.1 carbon-nitrogen hydrolase [Saccharospirillaceae bacterium]